MINIEEKVEEVLAIMSKEEDIKKEELVSKAIIEYFFNHREEFPIADEIYKSLVDSLPYRKLAMFNLKDEDFIPDSQFDDYLSGKKPLD